MKRFIVLTVILFLACLDVSAQTLTREQRQIANGKLMPYMYPALVDLQARGGTLGNMYIEYGDDPGFQAASGTTDEQYYPFSDFMLETRENMRSTFDPILSRALEANDPARLDDVATELGDVLIQTSDLVMERLNETLTPDQINRLRELEFQMNSPMLDRGFPIVNYDAYTVLNLTDRQQGELDKIRQEMREEQKTHFAEMSKLFPAPGSPRTQEVFQELEKKLTAHAEKGKKLTARIRTRIVLILDKDQEKRLAELQKNVPDFVKAYQKRMGQPPQPVEEEKYNKWKDSWRPGDPIPAEFRQQEKARRRVFPTM